MTRREAVELSRCNFQYVNGLIKKEFTSRNEAFETVLAMELCETVTTEMLGLDILLDPGPLSLCSSGRTCVYALNPC